MKIDGHPFLSAPINMVDFRDKGLKILTSSRVRQAGSIDSKVWVLDDEVTESEYQAHNDGRCERKSGGNQRRWMMSQMLLRKYQRHSKRGSKGARKLENMKIIGVVFSLLTIGMRV